MPLKIRTTPWQGKPRPKQLKGTALNPNIASQARYYAELRTLIQRMSDDTTDALDKFFKEPHVVSYFAQDASVSEQARAITDMLRAKFDDIFSMAAKPMAVQVADNASRSSATSLEGSLKELSGGLTIDTHILTGEMKDILTATIAENVSLIKSISSEYFTQIQGAVMRSITTGNGLADLVPFLQQHENITLRRARVIARDQTRKAFSNMNFARMRNIGITEYEWLHSAGGQKPRKLHQRMSGNVYRIDKPPVIDEKTGQRGKPGDLINCRCRAVPIIRFEQM